MAPGFGWEQVLEIGFRIDTLADIDTDPMYQIEHQSDRSGQGEKQGSDRSNRGSLEHCRGCRYLAVVFQDPFCREAKCRE